MVADIGEIADSFEDAALGVALPELRRDVEAQPGDVFVGHAEGDGGLLVKRHAEIAEVSPQIEHVRIADHIEVESVAVLVKQLNSFNKRGPVPVGVEPRFQGRQSLRKFNVEA